MTRKGKNPARLPAGYAKQISAITGADQSQTPGTSAPRATQRGPRTPEGSPPGESIATAHTSTPHLTIGTPIATELTPQIRIMSMRPETDGNAAARLQPATATQTHSEKKKQEKADKFKIVTTEAEKQAMLTAASQEALAAETAPPKRFKDIPPWTLTEEDEERNRQLLKKLEESEVRVVKGQVSFVPKTQPPKTPSKDSPGKGKKSSPPTGTPSSMEKKVTAQNRKSPKPTPSKPETPLLTR